MIIVSFGDIWQTGKRDLTVNVIGYQHCGYFHKLVSVKRYKEHHTPSIVLL